MTGRGTDTGSEGHDAATAQDIRRWRANFKDEIGSAWLYRQIAAGEDNELLSSVYERLARTEERHAEFWADRIRRAGHEVPALRPGWRSRMLGWLAKRYGAEFVLPTVSSLEQADAGAYDRQSDAARSSLPTEERSHARLLSEISGRGGMEGRAVARFEGRHRAASANALRAAVLGANDGLLSNFSLVMGVAGAQLDNSEILITGLAGLLAGAGSMAMGEWISVQNARELFSRQIAIEREELREFPDEEREELALIYEAKGLPQAQARQVAERIIAEPEGALDTLAREELGVDPEELGGSALTAAATSFVLFAIGAIFPVAPFLFFDGELAIGLSIALSVVGLFAIGALITLLTGRNAAFSGARQVVIGMAAAALTFGVGTLIGASVG